MLIRLPLWVESPLPTQFQAAIISAATSRLQIKVRLSKSVRAGYAHNRTQKIQVTCGLRGLARILGTESELPILKLLELHGSLTLPKISELTKISELECSSTLSNLITLGYVFRVGDIFSISFHGKERLKESRE
jgi:hypothetical protein